MMMMMMMMTPILWLSYLEEQSSGEDVSSENKAKTETGAEHFDKKPAASRPAAIIGNYFQLF